MARVPSSPQPFETGNTESLVLQACDDLDGLHVVRRAYACIEKLVAPQRTSEVEEIHPSRTELGALLGFINEELRRRTEAAEATMQAVRGALGVGCGQ